MKTRISSLIPVESISTKIFLIRGEKVLLDRDLANLYGVETKVLNQAVNRNISRFPADFMFRLTKDENDFLRSQIVTLKKGEHSKYLPAAFTEQGVAMLSSVLKSERAVQVNIAIMRAFVQMRKFFESNQALAKKLSTLEAETKKKFAKQHEQIALIFEAIKELMIEKEKPKRRIGY
ncbi:MAG: ORF6N domain-containing protein [Melioribacteraceae bacterium]